MTDSASPDDETGQDLVPAAPAPASRHSGPHAPGHLPADAMAQLLAFPPVPVRYRRDGWTPARQRRFIAALAECGCVLAACRRVGKSAEAAYRLWRRPDAAGFRAAWDAALRLARQSRASPSAPHWQSSFSSASSTSARAER